MDRSNFHPKAGDILRIRSWDSMADEFEVTGYEGEEVIHCDFSFTSSMRYLCGKVGRVREIIMNQVLFEDIEETQNWSISIDMVEPPEDFYEDKEISDEVVLSSDSDFQKLLMSVGMKV